MTFRKGCIAAALVCVFALVAGADCARAQVYEQALTGLAKDSFSDSEAAVSAVAASGHPLAFQIVEALRDGRLLFSADPPKVFLRDKAGATRDAATGEPAPQAAMTKPVRLNNRLRRAIDAALGSLTLLSPDPATRYDAAQAVFKSRDSAA